MITPIAEGCYDETYSPGVEATVPLESSASEVYASAIWVLVPRSNLLFHPLMVRWLTEATLIGDLCAKCQCSFCLPVWVSNIGDIKPLGLTRMSDPPATSLITSETRTWEAFAHEKAQGNNAHGSAPGCIAAHAVGVRANVLTDADDECQHWKYGGRKIPLRDPSSLKSEKWVETCSVADTPCTLQKLQADAHLWSPPQCFPLGSDEGYSQVDFDTNRVETVHKT